MVVNARSGQLSNRLITIAYALASAIEYRRNIRLTEFDDLKDSYECTITWSNKVTIKKSFFWQIVRIITEKLRVYFPKFRIPRVVSTWDYRNVNGSGRQAEKLRLFFSPKESELNSAKEICQKYFRSDVVTIGVHIRRGDYAQWHNGKFFYNDDVYNRNMHSVENEFISRGQKVQFIVFSNEPVNMGNITVKSNVVKSECNAVQDHWLMSNCDYLMGPPSTFTLWAAFMGKKLLAFIINPETVIHVADFQYHGLKVEY